MSIAGTKLEVDGIELNVHVEGDGRDVLLLHGFPESNSVWRRQIPVLVDNGFRVIAPDLRGFGESDAPQGKANYKLDRIVRDVLAVIDALGAARPSVVAHDWGGVIGWQLAMLHADRVERLAVMGIGHPSSYARAGFAQRLKGYYILFFVIPWLSETLLPAFDWWLLRKMTRYESEFAAWQRDLSRPGRLTAALNYYRANIGLILPRDWPVVNVPVLGLWGEGDIALTERQMTGSRNYVSPSFEYERVAAGTHWLQLEKPETVNALLLDFLA